MAEIEEEDEFEMQLRQEELARLAKEEGETLSRGLTYTDEDGIVMEWDHEKRAYFPKIDTDFIAQYQVNYGINYDESHELSKEEQQAQFNEYWKNYSEVCNKEQPALPQLDDEGNVVEQEENSDSKDGDKCHSASAEKDASENHQKSDPTSDEHYEYNLYYFGKEYAEAYRDYYRKHPDAEVLPDFIAQRASLATEADKIKDKKKKKEKGEKRKEDPNDAGWFDVNPESSTQLYINGLPLDITEDEFKDIVSKCGLIMFDPSTQKPKIKLYKDKEGKPKGDGLCTYIKPESVTLALQLLDGMDVRGHTISVDRAKFEMKGNFDPAKKKKKLSNKAKQRLKERQQKLFDWRPDKLPFQRAKHERIVILKNMFNIKEFDENPALINELRDDVRQECQKFGEVKKVVLYDRHPEGVISVTFKEPEEADACIAALNGRWFAQNRVVAFTHDGKTKYDVVETEEEKRKRLSEWEAYLEGKKKLEEGGQKEVGPGEESDTSSVGFTPHHVSDSLTSDTDNSMTDSITGENNGSVDSHILSGSVDSHILSGSVDSHILSGSVDSHILSGSVPSDS